MLYALSLALLLGADDDLPPDVAKKLDPPAATANDADKPAEEKKSDEKPAASEAEPASPGDKAEGADESESAAEQVKPFDIRAWWETMWNTGALGYMNKGGIFMWPILAMGIVALGVIIERTRSLKMLAADTGEIREKVQELLQNDRVEEALELCNREQGPVPAVLAVGLRKYLVLQQLNYDPGKIEEQVVKGMDDYSVHIVAALERHLPILATVSSAAPMVGFLGTVQGMVVSFDDIVQKLGQENIVKAAAGGIMIALLTTVFGLIVGIPAFVSFNYFTSVINEFVLEVEESATDLIESVTLQMAMRKHDSAEVPEKVAT